jgi:phosphoribosyl 1,2-cyclic phosphodiesterase
VELLLPTGATVIIDGGTGLRNLGLELTRDSPHRLHSLHLLMTHFHWDHIQGIPFFGPLYDAANTVNFYSSLASDELRDVLEGQMMQPYFPVPFEVLPAARRFICIPAAGIHFGQLTIHPFPMNHPQGATGYRLESQGAAIVHASDLEHGNPEMDRVLREYSQSADVLIYDAQYTPEEYESKRGWGHSTWCEAVRVARECKVKRLILFHHDPSHDDAFLDGIVSQARFHFENTDAASEGLDIRV